MGAATTGFNPIQSNTLNPIPRPVMGNRGGMEMGMMEKEENPGMKMGMEQDPRKKKRMKKLPPQDPKGGMKPNPSKPSISSGPKRKPVDEMMGGYAPRKKSAAPDRY